MKKYIVTGLVAVVAASSALAGTPTVESKKVVVPVEQPCLYRDMEFQVDAFGTGAFYRAGNPGWGGGLGLNVFFLRYIGLGFEQFVVGRSGAGAEWGSFGHLFLRYPICAWNLSPYAMVGIGKLYGDSQKSYGCGDVGGGLEYRFTENIGLFVDGRWVYSPDFDSGSGGGVLARTGLRFAF